jgi:hypothetical protein
VHAILSHVGLDAHAVVLVLEGAAALHLLEDLGHRSQALGQHGPDRHPRPHAVAIQPVGALCGHGEGDGTQVGVDVVHRLHRLLGTHHPLLVLCAQEGLLQGLQDGHVGDAQAELSHHRAHDIAGRQGVGVHHQLLEELDALLGGTAPLGPRHLLEGLEHTVHREWLGEQVHLLGTLAGEGGLGSQSQVPLPVDVGLQVGLGDARRQRDGLGHQLLPKTQLEPLPVGGGGGGGGGYDTAHELGHGPLEQVDHDVPHLKPLGGALEALVGLGQG